MKEIELKDASQIRIIGRTGKNRNPAVLYWTGSRMVLRVTGSELWVKLTASYHTFEPWINLLINGVSVSRRMVMPGTGWICLFRGMDPQKEKTVELVKETQAMSQEPDQLLAVWAIRTDGELLDVPEKKYRLEFIGDSITSGEGGIGSTQETEWISMWFSAVDNYACMTAQALDAEYHVVSQSGWGVLSGWNNDPHGNIPSCYDQVCGVQAQEEAKQPWDFSSWQPDAVIINLGTNDGGAFHSPAYTDPKTGETFCQRCLEDGSMNPADRERFVQAVIRFLYQIRRHNPAAKLVWVYGMIDTFMEEAILDALDRFKKESGDLEASYLRLPAVTQETVGARSHPGHMAHRQAASALTEYLRTIL